VPQVGDTETTWLPISTIPSQISIDERFVQTIKSRYMAKHGDTFLLELTYVNLKLPLISMLLSLLGLALYVLLKNKYYALGIAALTVLVQTAMLVFRTMISGRAPVTNMYETVLFSGYGALVLALIIGHFRKETIFIFAGLAYSVCTTMMMNFAGGMLSNSISPLVPVLRDNMWLSTHVTTIIFSYGALALSWVLGNYVLTKRAFGQIDRAEENYYCDLIYSCLKYGVITLAAGIILGGVWADYSWGRFWGWDPKETWSLIVLCIYMAILHGRYTKWIPNSKFPLLVAGSFMSVMMAWFGVNYILATGLHSYGFSEGGAVFLGSFFAVQTIYLIIAGLKMSARTNAAAA
jgi:cytochrome c-type biogenesis protein CcsB